MGCGRPNGQDISRKAETAEIYDIKLPVLEIEKEKFKEDQVTYFQVLLRDNPDKKINAPITILNSKFFRWRHKRPYTSLIQAVFYYRAYETAAFLL